MISKIKKLGFSDAVLVISCYVLLLILGIIILLPVCNLVAVSLSSAQPVSSGKVSFLPVGFHVDAYKYIMQSKQFFTSVGVSLFISLFGSALGVLLAVSAAFPLSKKGLPGRKWIMLFYIFTMMFNGGLIPTYLLIQRIKLINTIWALIIPSIVSVYNILIIKNYFEGLSASVEESAKIDGAGQLRILVYIVLPMSMPVLATIFMFYFVSFWNGYFEARMYITKPSLKTIQVYLQNIIFEASDPMGTFGREIDEKVVPQTMINAVVVSAMIPMLILYPSLQRFFVKGTMIGSVKE